MLVLGVTLEKWNLNDDISLLFCGMGFTTTFDLKNANSSALKGPDSIGGVWLGLFTEIHELSVLEIFKLLLVRNSVTLWPF